MRFYILQRACVLRSKVRSIVLLVLVSHCPCATSTRTVFAAGKCVVVPKVDLFLVTSTVLVLIVVILYICLVLQSFEGPGTCQIRGANAAEHARSAT